MASPAQRIHEFEQASGDSEGQKAWHTTVHEVKKSRTQLSDTTTTLNLF